MRVRPVCCSASLMAFSLASAPLLQKKTCAEPRRGEGGQPLRRPRANIQRQDVRVERQLGGLLGDRLDDRRVRMAEQGHRVPAVEIPVFPARRGRAAGCPGRKRCPAGIGRRCRLVRALLVVSGQWIVVSGYCASTQFLRRQTPSHCNGGKLLRQELH